MPLPHSTTNPTDDLPVEVADRRKRGWYTIDNVLLDVYGAQLGPHGIAVYNALARCADGDSKCWPGHAYIANLTGMSTKQVGREIDKLAGLHIIRVTPRYNPETKVHSSNLYTLLDIVNGMDTQSVGTRGGEVAVPRARDRKSDRTIPTKKGSRSKEKTGMDYVPAEYADIIHY